MGLAANIARRGGVYWWRGRIGPGRQPSRAIARSLRTRDPEIARVMGARVTGLAAQLREHVRGGAMTIEQAEEEIGAFCNQFPFEVDPKLFERMDAERATASPTRIEPRSLEYSAKQEHAMLTDFVRRMGPILERRADEVRTRPILVLDGVRSDWIADAVRDDRILAEICRLLERNPA